MNPVIELQDAVAARLLADSSFSGPPVVSVLTQRAGDLASQVDRQINNIGLAVVVMVPKLDPGKAKGELICDLVIGIAENVVRNRATAGTKIPAEDLVLAAYGLLVLSADWRPPGNWQPMTFRGAALRDTEDTSADIVWEAVFSTSARMSATIG